MFRKVLVGVDDTPAAHDAVRLAKELVSERGEVILAHVHGAYPIYGKGVAPEFSLDEEERAATLLARFSRESGIANVTSVGCPSAGRGLHEMAERVGADLLVLGSTRHGGVGRVLLGDDTREATNGAPCAVAVAPVGYAELAHTFRIIGVADNATRESREALSIGQVLAGRFDARLAVCEVIEPVPLLSYGIVVPYRDIREDWEAQAQEHLDTLDDIEPHVSFGEPADELATFSTSVDLLIVGSRDYGPVGRLFHSSVTARLSRSAHCPLLILTRDAREQYERGAKPPKASLQVTH